ncbi:MAG: transposase [Chitinophagaceae bacterium]|nr:transposase [Chitinophagaceae bacterium]
MEGGTDTFIFVHALWCTAGKQPLLSSVVRKVLFASLKKNAAEKGIQVLAANGGEEHVHCLFKLMPVQAVSAVIKQLKEESLSWLNDNKLSNLLFEWENAYSAWSVSPSTLDKAIEYINKQEEYHQHKSLEEELAAFNKMTAVKN